MKIIVANYQKDPDGNTTVSFMLPNDMYDKLCERLPKYGSRSQFFRTIVEQFLAGRIEVVQETRF